MWWCLSPFRFQVQAVYNAMKKDVRMKFFLWMTNRYCYSTQNADYTYLVASFYSGGLMTCRRLECCTSNGWIAKISWLCMSKCLQAELLAFHAASSSCWRGNLWRTNMTCQPAREGISGPIHHLLEFVPFRRCSSRLVLETFQCSKHHYCVVIKRWT